MKEQVRDLQFIGITHPTIVIPSPLDVPSRSSSSLELKRQKQSLQHKKVYLQIIPFDFGEDTEKIP
jgi:hypothetical protein